MLEEGSSPISLPVPSQKWARSALPVGKLDAFKEAFLRNQKGDFENYE